MRNVELNAFGALACVATSFAICGVCFSISLKLISGNAAVSKLERRFLWFSIFQSGPMLLETVRAAAQFYVTLYLNERAALQQLSEYLFYYMDLACMLTPYCLLVTNRNIRRILLPKFMVSQLSSMQQVSKNTNVISPKVDSLSMKQCTQ
ncbi:unnamed protein product, partial [Mesorhabditis spiculigera]